MTDELSRRAVLAGMLVAPVTAAGCLRFEDGGETTAGETGNGDTSGTDTEDRSTPTQTPTEVTTEVENQQVERRLQVVSAIGTDITDKEIGVVEMTVKLPPGVDEIDLGDSTVQWVDSSGTYTLVHRATEGSGADGTFGVRTIKDESGASPVLDDPDDRLQLVYDLGADQADADDADWTDRDFFGEKLGEGTSVSLKITTKSGGQTQENLVVPESLTGADAVQL